ncbi:hypothetical protein NQ317_006002 [Molorchus minor]|uniref:Major facilitator superfamily associated domain-containing protein n=1 Tax=Molorchus minor TaxID=1323400 RepID=A0ABQ9J414_9CUCU|nr:hypothetical protein NQ317_006002 [Molorchus minor]
MESEDYPYHGRSQPIPGVRPQVDPEAEGEVDPSMYPQPKDATHKIRGKTDFLETLFGPVDQELLVVKTFYFFFYSAFGSLFPLMGVYFKQMDPSSSSCRHRFGEPSRQVAKGKILLLASLASWIIFTVPLGSLQPPPSSCITITDNSSVLTPPVVDAPIVNKRSVNQMEYVAEFDKLSYDPKHTRAGQSPIPVEYAENYKEKGHEGLVQPIISSIVYETQDIQRAFFLLLLLVIIGEFFSAPAITLADSRSTHTTRRRCRHLRTSENVRFPRLGSGDVLRWNSAGSFHCFPQPSLWTGQKKKNYTICFATFSVLMGAAFITATAINFKYEEPPPPADVEKPQQIFTEEDKCRRNVQPKEQKTKIFAQTTREIPSWVPIMKQFKDLKCASFLFVAWFMGFGIGLIFTFLFWHLQDYGGSPTLFGVASVINHISEIFAYFFSFRLIRQMGHVKVLCLGLIANTLRFLYISWLTNPWWVLPFRVYAVFFATSILIFNTIEEFKFIRTKAKKVSKSCLWQNIGPSPSLPLSLVFSTGRTDGRNRTRLNGNLLPQWRCVYEVNGITHAAVWAACCSYIAHNTPPELRTSAQGLLQGVHHGFGRGCGAIIGGIFVSNFGSTATFRGYGLFCLVVLGAFVFINFYRADQGFVSDLSQAEDPRQVAEETSHLAPHGVPSNPLPRALSSTKLHEMAQQDGYGATYQMGQGGTLDIPGSNLFKQTNGNGQDQNRYSGFQVRSK